MVAEFAARFGGGGESAKRCRNALYFAEILPELGIDHLHIHFANQATYSALFLKALAGLSFSFTPQAQDFMVDLRTPELLREMARESAFIVAPCDDARRELADRCPDSAAKMVRIYNGIDPSGYPAPAKAPRSSPLRVVSVGRLIEFKGFHHLLSAVATARAAGIAIHLDLMGDGPWRERLEAQAAQLGLGDAVVFHGSVQLQQMKEAFAAADAFVLACIIDPAGASDMLPTVITEAMLSSLPVVSSRIAGIPEQVADGVTGLLTAQGDEAALANALITLARDPEQARRMGAAGRRRAESQFAASVTLPQLEAAFHGQSATARTAPPAGMAAYYDLAYPASRDAFLREESALRRHGVRPWLEAGDVAGKYLRAIQWPGRAFWLPDGNGLQMELAHWPHFAGTLASLRRASGLSEEAFAWAAPRALWLATQWPRHGRPDWLHAPGTRGAAVAAMVAALLEQPALPAAPAPAPDAPWWSRPLPRPWRSRVRAAAVDRWFHSQSRAAAPPSSR
jgi:glycosyltransferase involved in cell wall biosynthesis